MENELKAIGAAMRAQDTRSTRFPLFVVQEKVKVYNENGDERERADYDLQDTNDPCEACQTKHEDTGDYPEECDDCPSHTFVHFNWEWQFNLMAGVFLTGEACDDHIKKNAYHYNKPRSYAVSAWRNPEMQTLMEYLLSLTPGDTPDGYR